jgi:hypothetical protein
LCRLLKKYLVNLIFFYYNSFEFEIIRIVTGDAGKT